MKKRIAVCIAAAAGAASLFGAGDPYDYKELVTREVRPEKVAQNAAGHKVADFGRDAVGWLELVGDAAGPYEIVLGEMLGGRGEVTNA